VRDAATNAPLSLVGVQLAGTAFGGSTNAEGRYVISNVPQGIYTVEAKRVGYSATVVQNVRINAGAPTTRDLTMTVQALILSGVVSTGLVDPTAGSRAPFSVATVGGERLEIAAVNNPLEALAGKVAGVQIRGGTAPGSNVVIQIRNPLSVYGYTQPLIIIDGVIQMSDDPSLGARAINGSPLDLNSDNIESIEVVRGAAAAALYGQQAANGVINITTKRGTDIPAGTTRLSTNLEGGISRLGKTLPINQHHRYRVNEQGLPIDAAGRLINWQRESDWQNDPNNFMDNVWGVPIYDNQAAMYHTGRTYRNSLSLNQSSLATNFSISGSANHESGIFKEGGGASGQNVGVNIDYRAGNQLAAGIGLGYSKRYQANLALEALNSSAFLNAQAICVCIDITRIDPLTNDYVPFPDLIDVTQANPLYAERHADAWDRRMSAQVNGNASYRPTSSITLRVEGGYQRADGEEQVTWWERGALDPDEEGDPSPGVYELAQRMDETYNGRMSLQFLTGLSGWTVRGGIATGGRMELRNSIEVEGDSLEQNQRDFDFLKLLDVGQTIRNRRSIDYSANVALDYNQKYVVDLVYRSDGNSLLPPDTRWNSNGRASAAWQMSEEAWWPVASLTLFKPRYSIGTAGNNPNFDAKYELYNQLEGTGVVRINKANLGNSQIIPEEVTEQEFGLDMTFKNRYSLSLTYVRNVVKNIIRPDTIIAYTGFDTQQSNLGDTRGDTYEATLEAQWIQTRNLRWSSQLVLDRSRQKITRYPRSCERAGNSDASNNLFTLDRKCQGYVFGQMYGRKLVTNVDELSPRHIQSGTALTHFQRNDDGYLVPVGEGGQYTDGRWGENLVIDGITYAWGHAMTAGVFNSDGSFAGEWNGVLGQGLPDFAFGLGNQVLAGNWTFSLQTVGQVGGDIFNQAKMRSMNRVNHAALDQFGKPEALKKPLSYYTSSVSQNNNLTGRSSGLTGNRVIAYPWLLEPGSFLKITELSVRYRLNQGLPLLRSIGMTSGQVSLIARDLYTWTKYTGYDPQVSGTTQVTTARVDESDKPPNYMNLTARISLIF
jgi:TonB-linked SusC/RagA family outer membrane protein